MLCDRCGTTGTGSFCSQCGAPLIAQDDDPSDVFWAQDAPTIVGLPSSSQPAGSGSPEANWDDWLVARAPGSTEPQPLPVAGGPGFPPSSTRNGPSWPLLMAAGLAAVLVLTVGGGAAWWFSTRDDAPAAAPASGTDSVVPGTESGTEVGSGPSTSTSTEVVTSTSTPPPTTTVTSTSTTTAPVSASDQLGDLRDESLGRLVTDDSWGVSLSAKQDGTRDDLQLTSTGSHIFRLPDILELHETLESSYSSTASVYLLKAEDLGSTKGPDGDKIWMTILDPGGLSSRTDAESWCASEFPWLSGDDLDNSCYPRKLSSP